MAHPAGSISRAEACRTGRRSRRRGGARIWRSPAATQHAYHDYRMRAADKPPAVRLGRHNSTIINFAVMLRHGVTVDVVSSCKKSIRETKTASPRSCTARSHSRDAEVLRGPPCSALADGSASTDRPAPHALAVGSYKAIWRCLRSLATLQRVHRNIPGNMMAGAQGGSTVPECTTAKDDASLRADRGFRGRDSQ